MIKLKNILVENIDKLTLYHGTSSEYAQLLVTNGWQPNKICMGGNCGNPKYLYLTSDIEDARWYSNEKGDDTIIKVINIPIDYLRADPDDERGYNMNDLLQRISKKSLMPSKFILTVSLTKEHFKIV